MMFFFYNFYVNVINNGHGGYCYVNVRPDSLLVRKNMLHMAQQVEVEYRLFLMIDLSIYRSQPTFSGGCVKFYSLAFF